MNMNLELTIYVGEIVSHGCIACLCNFSEWYFIRKYDYH